MLLGIEDLDILNNPPVYPLQENYGIKQIDVNESIFKNNSTILFVNDEGLNPILKIFDMSKNQIGSDFTAFEICPGNYVFNISYLVLKAISGLVVGNYLIQISIGQAGYSRIVEVSNSTSVNNTANGGFR